MYFTMTMLGMSDVYCHDDVKGKCVMYIAMMMLRVSA